MQLTLNAQEMPLRTRQDLHHCFEQVRQRQFSELWLTAGDDGPSLTMLVNGASAWLVYLQDQDDIGFHSFNLSYRGPVELRLKFQLSNGQMDEYPAEWTLTLEEAFDACEYFVTTQGGRSPTLIWENS
jgi:hypothetical protein